LVVVEVVEGITLLPQALEVLAVVVLVVFVLAHPWP
jgi:hypothetical protein